ncbi:c-type cytochrome [Ramlibacter sp. AW1]|uniref:C-type cytochrome n=1 Tax=Ramlibacter aurantiacus TaxID=2801330 RepID=A0A936ZFY8_9BURK|nr:c-type cytochrome [Ramlibacter aurantiacus]MBL0420774.1 c-type cytochrome [Ramlibacter aurantiacus]
MFRPRTFTLALALCGAAMGGCGDGQRPRVEGGTADAGKLAIQRHGCVACHSVPGIAGVSANVGPPLGAMGQRGYLAGVIANTPENLVRWIRNPTGVDPRTAMPDLGISEREARDIAAYLYERT